MKKNVLLIVLLLSFVSCSDNDDDKENYVFQHYYGTWIQYAEPQYANDPSSNQYSYAFNKDKTFSKTRKYENINVTMTGTFEILTVENKTRFVLTYKEKNERSFISNCTGGYIESFTLDESGYLLNDARACDASFVFKKAN